jgi:hypothetical protein
LVHAAVVMHRWVLWSIVTLVAAGCGDKDFQTSATVNHTVHAEGPLRKIDTNGDQMEAALTGHLGIVDGCLMQQHEDVPPTMVLWPLDVHWDESASEVVFTDGRRLKLGTNAVLGGGFVAIEEIRTYWADGQSAIAALATCQPGITDVWVAGQEFDPYEAFDLDTHCGIYGTMIDGVWWHANTPLVDGYGGPPPGWAVPTQHGTMTFYGDDLAVFTTDQGLLARFKPTSFAEPRDSCS